MDASQLSRLRDSRDGPVKSPSSPDRQQKFFTGDSGEKLATARPAGSQAMQHPAIDGTKRGLLSADAGVVDRGLVYGDG
jgi:hypothetical protein